MTLPPGTSGAESDRNADFSIEQETMAKPLRLDLEEAESFPDGTVINVYRPIRTTG